MKNLRNQGFIRIFGAHIYALQMKIDYILCHGSGNRFVLLDALRTPQLTGVPLHRLARDLSAALGTDGLLVLDREGKLYGMRMWNTDGTKAEMCGNGIRCVARLAVERGLVGRSFTLFSGRMHYPVSCEGEIAPGLPAFGVEMPLRLATDDFPQGGGRPFLQQSVEVLDKHLRFSYLNPGNPHLVAEGDPENTALLAEMGRRVTEHPEVFPHGMNVSLYCRRGERAIFVATCERGVGLTASCGTAMTSAATAACLTGMCPEGKTVEVLNRGGKVRCTTRIENGQPVTRLVGNATWIERGEAEWDSAAGCTARRIVHRYDDEERAYRAFLESINR